MKLALFVLLLGLPLVIAPGIPTTYVTDPPDRAYAFIMQGASFNGLQAPLTQLLEAYVGETVLMSVVVPPLAEPHTFHLHGHPWFVPATGKMVDTFLLMPGDTHTFDVVAGGIDHEAGDWMYHCHVDSHMAAGMWGIFRVYPFAITTEQQAGSLDVRLDRLGEPVRGASFWADGAPAHALETAPGRYVVHAPADARSLTARAPELGESVARLTDETLLLEVSHAHD